MRGRREGGDRSEGKEGGEKIEGKVRGEIERRGGIGGGDRRERR